MSHEYDHRPESSPTTVHGDARTPGQSSRSALLRRPERGVASRLVQRKAADAPGAEATAPTAESIDHDASGSGRALIVEDDSPPGDGAMTKTQFLAALRTAVTDVVSQTLGPPWSVTGCPYIERWFTDHSADPAARLDLMARRYSGLPGAASATDYLAPICARLRDGVARWQSGQDVSAELAAAGADPDEVAAASPPRDDAQPTNASGAAVQRKQTPQAPATSAPDPAGVAAQLQGGASLGGEAARFGEVFGDAFSDVRVHTDARAGAVAGQLNAVALTVGTDIAFAPGAYRPGTPEGDALLAHELAHVVQQRGAASDATAAGFASDELETDADQAAAGAVAHLHGSALGPPTSRLGRLRAGAKRLARFAAGRLNSAVTVARCTRDERPTATGTHFAIGGGSMPSKPSTDQWGPGGNSTTVDEAETRAQLLADLQHMNAGGVFVFFGHGVISRSQGPRGVKASDGAEATGADMAAAVSADNDPPTMVVFGGCQTAGWSAQVSNAGVPIVVGIDDSVANIAAAAAINHFMERVNSGATLDEAKQAADSMLQQSLGGLAMPTELVIRYQSGYDGSMTLSAARARHQGRSP